MFWLLSVTIFLASIFLLTNNRYRWIYILYKTLPRDLKSGYRFFKLNYTLREYEKNQQTVPKIFNKLVQKHPNKAAFLFEDETWTFKEVEDFSNRVANFFKNEGFQKGDTVALLLESRPEYVALWLGLAKIGVVTALINSNLVSGPLTHCLNVSGAKAIISGTNFKDAIHGVLNTLTDPNARLFELSDRSKSPKSHFREQLEASSPNSPQPQLDEGHPKDKLLFIYTSGTTGLPKAAVITNIRYMFMALALNRMTALRDDDILYNPLPLYHSSGGMVGTGQALLCGITVAMRRKFSASNFWSDCAKYKCTVAQYIGEICRYILAAHGKDSEPVRHSVRAILGNGMRPQIWRQFVEQFRVEEVFEFYGATEGNSNLVNIDNTVGAVGFVPRYAGLIYPVTLIKCHEDTGEPIRNSKGLCSRCNPGETGVFIGYINPKKTVHDFSGYADKKSTEKKLIRDVFKKGDAYFNSGDILVQDELGNYFFKDRTGDTFRWKGENVATSEIEAVISNVVNLTDAVVYGVEIPGNEGRAGMVAIVDPDKSIDLSGLAQGLKKHLPSYAVPVFVRVMKSVPMTGTFKLKKTDLQKESFHLESVKDAIYMYDSKAVAYRELSRENYDNIMAGRVKL